MRTTRVKDIEFKSAEHVIEEIENMNVKGGSPFGRAAAWAFKLAVQQENISSIDDLKKRIDDLAERMHTLKPTMATIHNSSALVSQLIEQNYHEDV